MAAGKLDRPGPGRPRRFAPDEERRLIMDAAVTVMQRVGYQAATIDEILAESTVSRRAFYRHFATKDALLLDLLRRDAESVTRTLRARVEATDDAADAVHAWVDGYLSLFLERHRMQRVEVLSSEGAVQAAGYAAELAEIERILVAPLAEALRAGAAAGRVRSEDPQTDALTVMAVAAAICGFPMRRLRPRDVPVYRAAIMRWCGPALGIENDD